MCVCGGEGITIVSGPGVVVRSNPPTPDPPTGLLPIIIYHITCIILHISYVPYNISYMSIMYVIICITL